MQRKAEILQAQVPTTHMSLGTNDESSGIFDYYRRSVSEAGTYGAGVAQNTANNNYKNSVINHHMSCTSGTVKAYSGTSQVKNLSRNQEFSNYNVNAQAQGAANRESSFILAPFLN